MIPPPAHPPASPSAPPPPSPSAGAPALWTRGRRLALVVAGAWAMFTAGVFMRGLLPAPLGYPMPWGMFRTAPSQYRVLGAYGTMATGERVAISLDDHFHYARGSTGLHVYDVPRVLLKADRRTQAELADWLAARVARAGTRLSHVTLYVDIHDLDTGDVATVRLGRFRVDDGAR